jgi:hypothetical protein
MLLCVEWYIVTVYTAPSIVRCNFGERTARRIGKKKPRITENVQFVETPTKK